MSDATLESASLPPPPTPETTSLPLSAASSIADPVAADPAAGAAAAGLLDAAAAAIAKGGTGYLPGQKPLENLQTLESLAPLVPVIEQGLLKPGARTSEFWICSGIVLFTGLSMLLGQLPPIHATWAMSLIGGAYLLCRICLKALVQGHAAQAAQDRLKAQEESEFERNRLEMEKLK